ncbi:glycine--tRNA ligase subunit beta, partial [uncultured Parasutterella sp.]
MATLLIEIQTEELPPKALENLSSAFAASLFDSLKEQGFTAEDSEVTAFGAPRRIAAEVTAISERSPDKPFRQKLVPAKIGLDADGNATAALKKKMAALGIECEPSQLAVVNDGKQDQLYYDGIKPGVLLAEGLQAALDKAVKQLPIPKVMSYQLEDGRTVEFVRPVKHLVALLDDKVVDVELFGLKAGRDT